MEESAPTNLPPTNEDIITPQDSLDASTTVNVTPQAGTSLDSPNLAAARVTPATTVVSDATPQAPVAGMVKNKLIRRAGIASALLLAAVLLMAGSTFAYRSTHKPVETQEEKVAQIKDQPINLDNTTVGTGPDSLRVGVSTLFVNGDISLQGILRFTTSGGYGQLAPATLSANQNYTLPNASGTFCLDSNNCGYATSAQIAAATLTGGTGVNVANNQITNTGVLALNGSAGSLVIQGTNGQINVAKSGNTLALATPQNIDVTSSPTFASINLTSGLGVASGGTGATSFTPNGLLVGNGSNPLNVVTAGGDGLCLISDTISGPAFQACPGVSPSAVSASSAGTNNTLAKFTGNQTIANSTITDDGITVTVAANLVADSVDTMSLQSSGTLSIGAAGQVTVGTTNQILALQGNGNSTFTANSGGFTSVLGFATPTGNRTITVPNESGTICLQGSANCGFALTGAGVSSLNSLTGALSIANASGAGATITINDASTSQKGIAQFNSTNFNASSGLVNTIQDIALASSPQFAGLTLTGNLTLGASGIVISNNIQNTGNGNDITINAGNDNIIFSNNGGANTFIFPTTGGVGQVICTTAISCAAGGGQAVLLEPGSAQTASANTNAIHVDKTGGSGNLIQLQTSSVDALVINSLGDTTIKNLAISGTLNTNNVTPTGALTVGSTSQQFTLQGNSSSVVTATGGGYLTSVGFAIGSGGTAPTGNITYQFRNDNTVAPGTYDVCTTAGNCAGGGSGVTTGGGTAGRIAKFTAGTAIDDSIISESGSVITIAGAEVIQGSSGLTIGTGAVLGVVSWRDGSSAFSATLQPTTLSGNQTLTIPNASGTLAVSASGPLVLNATTGNLTCPSCVTTSTGVTSLNSLTGALSIANASGAGATITINDASTSQKGIAQFNSTNFSASSGTINTIQDIATSASPSFQNMTLQGSTGLTVGSTTNLGQIGFKDGTNDGYTAIFSPTTLTGNRAITIPNAGGTLAVSAAGNLNLSAAGQVSIINNPTFSTSVTTPLLQSAGTLAITPGGALTVGSTGQALTLQGNGSTVLTATSGGNTTTVSFATPTGTRSIVLPNESGTVCLQGSVSCGFSTGGGNAFIQNGNSFGALASLGTLDNYNLNLVTNSTARIRITNTGFTGINDTSPGNTFSVNGPSTDDSLASTILTAGSGSNKALVVQASTGQTANLQEWQSSGGAVQASISNSGALQIHSSSSVYGTISTTGSNGGMNIVTSTGGSILINPDLSLSLGTVNTSNIVVGRSATDVPIAVHGLTTFQNVTASNVAVTVKGATSQTGNLQEWQSSGATVLLNVTSDGSLQAGSSSGADAAGRNLVLEGGQSTGNANGGNINLRISKPGSSGSSSNSYNTVATFSGATGAATFQNAVNSANALQVLNAAGNQVLNVDTTTQTTTLNGLNSTATLGSELVTSNAFNNGTYWTCGAGWTTGASSATHTSGTTTCAATASNLTTTSGGVYQVSYTVSGATGGAKVTASIGGTSGSGYAINGTQTVVLTAANTNALTLTPEASFNGTISAVSVKLITVSNSVLTVKSSDASTGLEVRTSGSNASLFIGTNAGKSATSAASFNMGLGNQALQSNTTGSSNTAVGNSALLNNTTGYLNVALGALGLSSNTTGSRNVALGGGYLASALQSNVTGSSNVATGASSLILNTTGSYNSAYGDFSLGTNVTGSYNSAFGNAAGYQDTDGFTTGANLSNSTAIGNKAQVQQSNSLILGGTGSDAVKVGIGTTAPDNALTVTGVMYSTGTASQSSTTVTGSGTTWTASMVGNTLYFANGSKGTITGFTDATHLTLSTSQTVSSQAYRIQYKGLQVTNAGKLGINTLTPANSFSLNDLTTADSLAQAAISTGSATNKGLVVQGVSGQSANLQEWQTSTGSILASIGATGATLFKNSADSTSAFQVQSSTGSSLFNVDSLNNKASVLGNNSGALKNWTTNGSSGLSARDCHASVYAAGFVYVIGGNNGGTVSDQVFYARVNANGSLGDWTTSSQPLPATRDCLSATYANGYIFVTGGSTSTATTAQNTVWSAKVNLDGSTSGWNTTLTVMPFKRTGHQTMAYNGYLYIFGGRDETQSGQDDVYYARIYADGTIGSWVATNVLPSNGRVFSGGVIANGYVYLVGGFTGSDTDVTYAKLNLDGTVGSWTTDSDTMPGARDFLTATVNNGYLYALGGNDSVIDTDTVYYTKLNADGSIGSWTTDTSVLPAARNSHTTVTANGYVYVIGGYGGGSVSTVYYASGARLSVGASLDLVGSSGQNLSEGGSGGSITAGNGIFVGSLQVQGSASFGQGLTVAGNLVVSGNVAFTGTLTAGVATFTGTFTVNGHIISGNVSGTTTIVVGAGAGSGASASLSGNDTAGVITVNTGTGAAAGDLGTITFGSAYGAAPTVVITPKAIPGGGTYPQYQYDSATGTFTLKSFNALTDSSTYTFSYHIIQ